jgi:hypothetical protein
LKCTGNKSIKGRILSLLSNFFLLKKKAFSLLALLLATTGIQTQASILAQFSMDSQTNN